MTVPARALNACIEARHDFAEAHLMPGRVVHLTGALGRPAWALISATPEWR